MTGQLPELSTTRLRLLRPEPRHAAALARLANDYDITKMTSRMPFPYEEKDARAFIDQVQLEDPRTDCTWTVEVGGEAIGVLAFFSDGGLGPEIGYWIGRPFWGSGYASEALDAALRYADREWRKKLVVAGHFADNPASGRVLVKAGFLYTGVVEPKFSLARGADVPLRRMIRLP